MMATKRRLEVLQRKGELKGRTDLPRKSFGARRARFAILVAQKEKAAEPVVEDNNGGS